MTDENLIRVAIPFMWDDPSEDPDEETLLVLAQETASEVAATRDMHAVNVRLLDVLEGLYGLDGKYVCDEDGIPISPRVALFTAEGITI